MNRTTVGACAFGWLLSVIPNTSRAATALYALGARDAAG